MTVRLDLPVIAMVGLAGLPGAGRAQVELQAIVARRQVAACEPFYVAATAVNRGPSPVSGRTDVMQFERWDEEKQAWNRDQGWMEWRRRRPRPVVRNPQIRYWQLPAASIGPRHVGELLVVEAPVLLFPGRYRTRLGAWHSGLASAERAYTPWCEFDIVAHAHNQERIRPENEQIWWAYCQLLGHEFTPMPRLPELFAKSLRTAAVFLDERFSPGLRLVATLRMAQVEIGHRQGMLTRGLDGNPVAMATVKRAELRSSALAWYRKLDTFALDAYTGSHGCFAGKVLEFKVETAWHVGLKDEGLAAWLSLRRLYPDTIPVQYERERWSRTYGD